MTRNLTFCLVFLSIFALAASGCIIATDDKCDGVTCSGHGVCVEVANAATCDCDDTYHADGLNCVFDGYTVSLDWTFGPAGSNCTQAQVGNVEVELLQNDVSLATETVACADGGVEIAQLEDGTYTILLTGISNGGERWYYASADATVAGQDEDLGSIMLDPIGFVTFGWTFDGLDCLVAGVDKVKVKINTADGLTNLYTSLPVIDCESTPFVSDVDLVLGDYNLVLEASCTNDPFTMGYKYDAIMQVTEKGENNYGTLDMPANGAGCP